MSPQTAARQHGTPRTVVVSVCAVLLVLSFGLCCVSQMKTGDSGAEHEDHEFRTFSWVVWNEERGAMSWNVVVSDGVATVTHMTMSNDRVVTRIADIDDEDAKRLYKLIDDEDFGQWNGIYGVPRQEGLTLTYTYPDDTTINMSGDPTADEGLQQVNDVLAGYFESIAGKYGL